MISHINAEIILETDQNIEIEKLKKEIDDLKNGKDTWYDKSYLISKLEKDLEILNTNNTSNYEIINIL